MENVDTPVNYKVPVNSERHRLLEYGKFRRALAHTRLLKRTWIVD